ncbi:MAG TPA: FG-GAP-like repeat-containing protein [Fimbriiglobus sp.]|jgi:hypothetical protein
MWVFRPAKGPKPSARNTPARLVLDTLEARDCPAITVRLDYQFDASHFFDDPAKRAALQRAVDAIAPRLQDHLAAITPSGVNTWTIHFQNPATGGTETVVNPTVGADEMVLYVMGAALPGNTLGRELAWSYSSAGLSQWNALLKDRGQTGAAAQNPTDFGPWGGVVAFDTDSNWNFGAGLPAGNQFDFLSVAEHELFHVFGFGADNAAFSRWVSAADTFNGPHVVATYGSPAPVVRDDSDGSPDHWLPGTTVNGSVPVMVPVLPIGARQTATSLDFAALQDIGWHVVSQPAQPPAPVPPPTIPPVSPPRVPVSPPSAGNGQPGLSTVPVPVPPAVVGIGAVVNGEPTLEGLSSTGTSLFSVPAATGGNGVTVASADFNGDGVLDWAVGSGPGDRTEVRVLDGRTLAEIADIFPFEASFVGGVNVAAGDLTGDGRAELIVTPDDGGGPRVRAFDPTEGYATVVDFFGIEDDAFRGGARAAVGDVNGDGVADLLVAAGLGGGPRVAVYNGRTMGDGDPRKLFGDIFAADAALRDGVFLAAADFNADGYADVLVGAVGAGNKAVLLNGRDLSRGSVRVFAELESGFVSPRSGVHVAAADVNGDGKPDAVVGSDGNGRVIAYNGRTFSKLFDVAFFPDQIAPISVG